MIVIGIDPGTATTGFSIIQKIDRSMKLLDFGVISTAANQPLAQRLNEITENLDSLINQWQPTHAAIEEIFFSTNVKTAISVAQSRGAVMHHLYKKGLQISEYNPLQIKTTICGHGRAEKFEVQKMVQLIFKLTQPPKPDDAADAVAIAYTHLSNSLIGITT